MGRPGGPRVWENGRTLLGVLSGLAVLAGSAILVGLFTTIPWFAAAALGWAAEMLGL